jgi:23S rRNA pseudouridine955/2504/2580 synthase
MNNVYYVEISAEEDGQRLDNFLLRILKGVPKSHIYRMIRGGEVRVNKKRVKPSTRILCHDQVRVPPVRTAQEKEVYVGGRLSERLLNCVIYEDDQLLVVNKPAGIAVHGGSGLSLGLIEALRQIRGDLHYLELVHRLDKETSGVLLLAKKRSVLRSLQALLEARTVTKTYWAVLIHPWLGKKSVIIDEPLEKNILKSGERIVVVNPAGKPSLTSFKVLENYQYACWVEAKPKTGRTHQIRVHSACMGHAILGDEKYGKEGWIETLSPSMQRLYLHARAIQFNLNGKEHLYQAELDDTFALALKTLRSKGHHEKVVPLSGI